MNTTTIIALTVIYGCVCLAYLLTLIFSLSRKKMRKLIETRFNREEIVAATTEVNFLGEQSKGGRQIRGNGALVLTRHSVFFFRAAPQKEYRIPLEAITRVSLPGSFNGKSIFRPLLCVHYRAGDREDAMAWVVRTPVQWKETIDKLLAG